MLKPTLGLLGIVFLLLGIVAVYVASESSQVKVISLSDEAVAQLVGGYNDTQASTVMGSNKDESPTCDGSNETDCEDEDAGWKNRTWHQCKTCYDTNKDAYIEENLWVAKRYYCSWNPYNSVCEKKCGSTDNEQQCRNSTGSKCDPW